MYNANSPLCITKLIILRKALINKTISNFETKPSEILQDNIEFLQSELRSKDEKLIKTLMETQITVLENLPLNYSSKNVDFIRANTVPGTKSYAGAAMSCNTKRGITKKVVVFLEIVSSEE